MAAGNFKINIHHASASGFLHHKWVTASDPPIDEDLNRFCLSMSIKEGNVLRVRIFHTGTYMSLTTSTLGKKTIFPNALNNKMLNEVTLPFVREIMSLAPVGGWKDNVLIDVKIWLKEQKLRYQTRAKVGKDRGKTYIKGYLPINHLNK